MMCLFKGWVEAQRRIQQNAEMLKRLGKGAEKNPTKCGNAEKVGWRRREESNKMWKC